MANLCKLITAYAFHLRYNKTLCSSIPCVGVMSDVLAHNESNRVALSIDRFYGSMVTVVSSFLRISFN